MSDHMDERKERLKIEEDDLPAEEAVKAEKRNISDELQNLGRQVAETLQAAWESEERQKIESEVRQGVRSFANEIDKVIREARESQAAKRLKEEATEARTKVESTDVAGKARSGVVQGLHWLSEELESLADSFTPAEKEPKAESVAEEPAEGESA